MLASRTFSAEDQAQFAALSGDFNPVHLDPLAARRTQAGVPIVHGIHTLLWLLESIAARYPEMANIAALKVQFHKAVYMDDRVDADLTGLTTETMCAKVSVDGIEVVRLAARFGAGLSTSTAQLPMEAKLMPRQATPSEPGLEEMEGLSGRVPFAAQTAAFDALFPHAAKLLGSSRIGALACSTYLVGMVVPGLHSIFAALDLNLTPDDRHAGELCFAVSALDRRLRRIVVQVDGGGLTGSLDTFSGMPPVRQPSMDTAASLVRSGEFSSYAALIVGGSRGLGEVAAKLIAAGGGKAIITYASGAADARDLAAQINEWGGRCEVAAYDVRRADAYRQLREVAELPPHFYYFATPAIFKRKASLCTPGRLDEFNEFYAHGFFRLIEAASRLSPEAISVFYPSTVYVEARPAAMTEYAMSKAAGEILCADIARFMPKVRVLVRRLPRLPTDQTASLIQAKSADPLEVVLAVIREMRQPIA